MTSAIYYTAANEMELLLIENNIQYIRKHLFEGWQFYIHGTNRDIICHGSSYGGNDGL